MVITLTTLEDTYTGDNATVTFAITLPFKATGHIKATLDGVATVAFGVTPGSLVDGHYDGGSLVFTTAPGSGVAIVLYCDTPVTQDYIDADAINSLDISDVEQALDHMTLIVRDNKRVQQNSATDAIAAAADAVATAADVVLTGLDVVSTGLDVVSTNADVVLTGLDVVTTNADVVLTAADVVSAAASAAAAVATASTLSGTLTGNYVLPAEPTVDGSNEFALTEQMKAMMDTNFVAVIPTSGLTATWHAWLFNNTGATWSGQSCSIKSTVYTVEAANGTSLGTGTISINHPSGEPLFLYYDVNGNKVIVVKLGGL
jgi:hypothetical protein